MNRVPVSKSEMLTSTRPRPLQGTILRCPRCRGGLEGRANDWFCHGCGLGYPVVDGIVDFRCSRKRYYFNPVPREAMVRLVSEASPEDWPGRIKSFLRHVKVTDDWVDNLVVDGRYAWKLLLELPDGARVLDLGCGLGNLAKNLAPNVGELFALDLTWERLEFARLRFSLFNKNDAITLLAGGDGPHLPFADDSLDAVILSGVLEWVADDGNLWEVGKNKVWKAMRMLGSPFGNANPRRRQLDFLREIRRVLRPQGQLFVAIENRLNHEYFRGRPDHHSGLKYGSLLPRLVANVYSIAMNRFPYRTYTYSQRGYRKLLNESGYRHQEFFGLLPGYSKLDEIVPLKQDISYWRPRRPRGLKARFMSHPRHVPAFAIIASSGAHGRLLDRLKEKIEADLDLEESLTIESYFVTSKDKGILVAKTGAKGIIVKLPFNDTAMEAEERNRALLGTLIDRHPLAPKPMTRGELSRVAYFVEEAAPGVSLAESWNEHVAEETLGSVTRVLDRMNENLEGCAIEPPSVKEINDEIAIPLRRIVDALEGETRIGDVAAKLMERLVRLPGRRGLVHGDFSVNNLFVLNRSMTLIDWENGSQSALPVLDAVNFLDSLHRLREPKKSTSDVVLLLARKRWPVEAEADFLQEQCRRSGIASERLPDLVAYYWIRHMGHQLRFHLQYDVATLRRRVEPFLSFVLEELAL